MGREEGKGGGSVPRPPQQQPPWDGFRLTARRAGAGAGAASPRRQPAPLGAAGPLPDRAHFQHFAEEMKLEVLQAAARLQARRGSCSSRGEAGGGAAGSSRGRCPAGPPGVERSGAPCRVWAAAPGFSLPPFRSVTPARMQTPRSGGGCPRPRRPLRAAPRPRPAPARSAGPKSTPGMRTTAGGGG